MYDTTKKKKMVIPRCVMNDTRLSHVSKVCFGLVSRECEEEGMCFMTAKDMGEELGYGESVMYKCILELRDGGYVERVRVAGISFYVLRLTKKFYEITKAAQPPQPVVALKPTPATPPESMEQIPEIPRHPRVTTWLKRIAQLVGA
jgi:hypothetical protein